MPNPYRATTATELRKLATGLADADERNEPTPEEHRDRRSAFLAGKRESIESVRFAEREARKWHSRYERLLSVTWIATCTLAIIAVAGWVR